MLALGFLLRWSTVKLRFCPQELYLLFIDIATIIHGLKVFDCGLSDMNANEGTVRFGNHLYCLDLSKGNEVRFKFILCQDVLNAT